MKKIILLFIAIYTSNIYGIEATDTIAQMQIQSGFITNDYPRSITIELKHNGDIFKTDRYLNSVAITKKIASIEWILVRRIESTASELLQANLVSQTPDQPICANAPDIEYSVRNKNGEMVLVAGKKQCHEMKRDDGLYFKYHRYLESFSTLSYLAGILPTEG